MSLSDLVRVIRKHYRYVIALPILCAAAVGVYAFRFMPDTYSSSLSMYVLTTSAESSSISNSDLSASQMLTNDVAGLAKSDYVLEEAAAALDLPSLEGYSISVTSSSSTRIITLTVTGSSPEEVARVANQVAQSTDAVAQDVMGVTAVKVIDKAKVPTSPSGPRRLLYIAYAAMAGLFLAVCSLGVRDMVDTRVKTADELEEILGYAVIGRVPELKGLGR